MKYDFVLSDLYNKALTSYGEKTALKYYEQQLTYDQLHRESNRLANALIRNGINIEDPVALIMSNCLEFIVSDIAIMKAGATKVPLNDMLGEKEILYMLENSQTKLAIIGPNFYSMLSKIRNKLPSLQTIVGLTDSVPDGFISWKKFISETSDDTPSADIKPSHRASLGYTGGTTGLPKGIVQTQENLSINLLNHLIELELTDKDNLLFMTPLPHAAGRFLQVALLKGTTIHIRDKFDAVKALQLIEQEQITVTFMVPTMIYRLLDAIDQHEFDVSSIRTIIYGASPMLEERLKQGLEVFGPVFFQIYGQSEAPNLITTLKKSDHSLEPNKVHRLLSCGKPTFMSKVKIMDENNQEVPIGEQGEICVKAPYVMARYHNMPEKTAETIIDGWLHTGDVGKMDEDGYVYLLDRKNDMIVTGGMNVYSTEVENVIQQHPGVQQVAVIGIPHDDWGEQVIALVIPNTEKPPTEEELIQFSKKNLAKYKQPKQIKFVSEFPLTPYGKIDKKEIRKSYWKGTERAIH